MEKDTRFDYDQQAAVILQEVGSERRGDITVKDITYASPVDGAPISAYLVLPDGAGPFPAILYVHWYEPTSPTSNRTQFLEEAVALAGEGVVSLLVETMWSEPTWYRQGRTLDTDFDDAVGQTIELRRALDVLLAQPQVDAERIAYVGHDFGAMFGAILAGVDRRAGSYVLIAGASNFNKWMLFGVPEDQAGLDEYKARMEALAPTAFIDQAAPAPILFQFGTQDFYTPREDIDAFYAAASEPKTLKLYDTEHEMALDEIREDRLAFLREQLAIVK